MDFFDSASPDHQTNVNEPSNDLEVVLPREPGPFRFFMRRLGGTRYPSSRMGYFRPRFTLAIYLEAGSATMLVGSRALGMQAGDLIIIPPAHRASPDLFRVTERDFKETRFWICAFTGFPLAWAADESAARWPEDPFTRLSRLEGTAARVGHIGKSARSRWLRLCAELEEEGKGNALGRTEKIQALLTLLFYESTRTSGGPTRAPLAVTRIVSAMFAHIDRHRREPLTPGGIAAALGHSRNYLSAIVRKETGRSPGTWIVERKLQMVADLLIRSNLLPHQLAAEIGLEEGALRRYFIRAHGMELEVFRALHAGAFDRAQPRRRAVFTELFSPTT